MGLPQFQRRLGSVTLLLVLTCLVLGLLRSTLSAFETANRAVRAYSLLVKADRHRQAYARTQSPGDLRPATQALLEAEALLQADRRLRKGGLADTLQHYRAGLHALRETAPSGGASAQASTLAARLEPTARAAERRAQTLADEAAARAAQAGRYAVAGTALAFLLLLLYVLRTARQQAASTQPFQEPRPAGAVPRRHDAVGEEPAEDEPARHPSLGDEPAEDEAGEDEAGEDEAGEEGQPAGRPGEPSLRPEQPLRRVTDRTRRLRQAEDELRASQQFVRGVLESIQEGVTVMDRDLRYIAWNPYAERLWGMPAEDLLGRRAPDVFPHIREQGLDRLLARALQGETVRSGDIRFTSPVTGEERWYVDTYGPLYEANGRIVGVVSTQHDITERRRAEEALRESETRLRTFIHGAPVVLFALDRHGTFTLAEGLGLALLGLEPGQVVGRSVHGIETLTPEMLADVERALAGHAVRSVAFLADRTFDCQYVPLFGADGTVSGAIGIATDVTERARAEAAVYASEAKFRAVAESALDAILIADRHGRIRFWNSGAARIFGFTEADILGEPLARILPGRGGDLRPPEPGPAPAEPTGGRSGRILQLQGLRRSGELFPLELTLSTWEAEDERFDTIIARDTTERKRHEAELVAARDKAEEMTRLKTAFLANMSHELRTPLAGILGLAQMLREEVASEHREFTDLIVQSGHRLLETLNSVLEFARLEAGGMAPALRPVEVVARTCATADFLRPLAEKKGLALRVQAPTRPILSRLDAGFFDRVLSNLIGNAIKFTEQGSITVRIEDTEAEVRVHVHDTGVGISREFLAHLFDEFRQESTGLSRDYEGAGLGLAITKRLVEMMQGTISVESEKERGSVFTVTFARASTPGTAGGESAPQRAGALA